MPTDDDDSAVDQSPQTAEPPRPSQGPRRKRRTRTLVVRSLAVLLAVVVGGGALVVYLKYRQAWDSIARVNVSSDLPAKSRPPADPNAINILVIGSTMQVGTGSAGTRSGTADGSDTIMVVHIAPGAHAVDVMSIPRDSVVPILNCTPEGGTPGQTAQPLSSVEQINATYSYGGPGCLWKTIEQTTGIHINDFIELTYSGFVHVINQLGGVNVCLPQAVNDPMSGLNLSAGMHHVFGPEALAFWRTRENLGTGSDPQRIQRDQFLMASLFQGVERSNLLKSPTTMLSIIDTITTQHDLVTDSGLTPGVMLRIGEDLRGIKGGSVQFVTVPWTTFTGNAQWIKSSESPGSGNVNWVQWVQPQANALFSAIAHDNKLPTATSSSPAAQTASPAASPAAGSSSSGTSHLASTYGGITGNVNICHDSSAFAGPDG